MKYEKSCGGIIYQKIDSSYQFLLVQMNMGHWSFPKGHLEENETEEETAIREIKEETNIDVKLIKEFRAITSYSPAPNTFKDVIYFLGIPTTIQINRQVEEIKNICWMDSNEAIDLLTYDNDKNLLIKALAFIKNQDD